MQLRDNTKKYVLCGVLTAMALCLSLADMTISSALSFLPGVKLGLANIVTLFALYRLGGKYAAVITAARCLLAGILSGMITMMFFSLAGGFLSLFVMLLLKNKISEIKLSVTGGIAHNCGQMIVAVFITSTAAVAWELPLLIVFGCISGFAMGIVCKIVLKRIKIKP